MKTKQIINYLVIAILVIILGLLIQRVYKMITKSQNESENYFIVNSDGVTRTMSLYDDLQKIVKEITGSQPSMCFPNYQNTQDSREYEAKFYKNLNHLITDAVMKCIEKRDFTRLTKIYLLLPELFKMESKTSYQFIAYDGKGPDKKVIPLKDYVSSNNIKYVEIISPDGKKMTNNDVISFLKKIDIGFPNLDPYYVTSSIGPGGKPVKVAMNPTLPPLPPSSPTPKPTCRDGNYCCKNGICFQPTKEYYIFYKMAKDVVKAMPDDSKNTLFDIELFGKFVPYLYVKRNSPIGIVKTIPSGQNDKMSISPFVCCNDDKANSNCKMAEDKI